MLLSEFDFQLPRELIAQTAAESRDGSRMLSVRRSSRAISDETFRDFPSHLREGDVVVLNDTKVFPARLEGRTDSGASVELFLITDEGGGLWSALAKPAKRLKPGKRIDFSAKLSCEVIERTEDGKVRVRFADTPDFFAELAEVGRTPLPPYIKRDPSSFDADRERYQTVYAASRGAIAAPTAGLHFTRDTFDQIAAARAHICKITLHVGYGTFEPVRVTDLSQHRVAAETMEISENAAAMLNAAKQDGRRIIAIGTTTTRALESSLSQHTSFAKGKRTADLTITPGYSFRAVDAMLTNFHLPKSSLLVLVSTFAGHELIMDAYRHAVAARYRFYSYGDCMFIE